MVGLRHVATLAGRSDMPLATVTDLLMSGTGRLYTVTRSDGGMGVFDISGAAAPVLLGQAAYRSAEAIAGFAPMVASVQMPDTSAILIPAGMSGCASSSYGLTATGLFGAGVSWDRTATLPSDLALVAALKGAPAPGFIAVRCDGSLMPVALSAGTRLSAQSPGGVVPQRGGAVTALDSVQIGGKTILVTASSEGQSLVSYQVLPDLRLARLDLEDGKTDGIGFAGPSAVKVVQMGGESYVILASAGSSSLTVFQLGADGALSATDHVIDSRDSRFQMVSVLETLTLNGQVYVLAAGADDGVSLLTLLPGGQLIHLGCLADTEATRLSAISALAAGVSAAGQGQIYVASSKETGLTRLALDVQAGVVSTGGAAVLTGSGGDDLLMTGVGVTQLRGGAGDDILVSTAARGGHVWLEGGAGADVFVIQPGAGLTTLTDYTPGTDRLDLSLLPMLRGISQITFTPTSTGAFLSFNGTVIEVNSANGHAISAADFTSASLLPISHFSPIAPAAAPEGLEIFLGNRGGAGTGDEGDDTLWGGAGADTLRGNGGNDRIEGGGGNDDIGGGAGNDLIRVSAGRNVIWGGTGDDTIEGGSGADTIIGGGDGRNQLFGFDGDDWISAGSGGDFMGGGLGNDTILGGAGSDTIYAGLGNDFIGGGAGDDQIWGAAGSNLIYAGFGNDTVQGGVGSDTILGSAGRNQLFGNDGNDLIYTSAGGDLAAGGAGNDSIFGAAGEDTIYAGLGNDFIGGGAGNDVIYAGAGVNRIYSGLGNDTIVAGSGKDMMTGGPGADVFVFTAAGDIGVGAGRDVITDFVVGVDTIDLQALHTTYNGSAGVVGGGAASFYYFAAGGLLIGDQNGDGAADWVLELTGAPAVKAGDFLL
jgi:Ca2+-binding RTX toxin-like protein